MMNRLIAHPAFCIGLIVVATMAAYLPVSRAGFIWDDDDYVTRNPTLRSAEGLRQIWTDTKATPQYYPLAFTSFWIEYHLWGLAPLGYHIVNVLLHAGCAILIWRLLLLLGVPGALLAAMLFAVHPLHVESVAWITERKNVLSGLFYLAATLAYLRWIRIDEPGASRPSSWLLYVLAFVFFLCALLSKSVTATLPAAVLLVLWWKRGRLGLRDILPMIPWFVVAAAMVTFTVSLERQHVGTEQLEWNLGVIDRILLAGRAASFYLWKLVWPANLIFFYPRWQIDSADVFQYVFPVGVLVALVALFALRRRAGRGPLTAALYYLGTLSPALGFVMAYPMRFSFVADHFCYLASIGPIVLFSALVVAAFRERLPVGLPAALAVLGILGVLTWQQTRIYKDEETLWHDTIARNPGAWAAHNNLGRLQAGRGQFDKAAGYFAETARLFPEFPEAHYNLGNAYVFLGRLDEAEAELKEALRLVPHYVNAHYCLGLLREKQGRPDEAIAKYRDAVGLNKYFIPAHMSLTQLLVKQGRTSDALAELDRGIVAFEDKPDASLLHKAKAGILLSNAKMEEAIVELRQAVRLAPGSADMRLRLANALFQAGKLDDAATAYVETLAIDNEVAQAHYNLGVIRVSQGLPQEGYEHFVEAVRIKPDYADAHFNLAQLFEASKRLDEAAREYREVLRISPGYEEAQQRLDAVLRRSQSTTAPSQ
ncbi:MAG TPA: tetratricopeptide repeat protein [Phycisphaerae bacterium]|nr:tetratricopeptide repeat protein [Phycisphaerae bacterium]